MSMLRSFRISALAAIALLGLSACATAPSPVERLKSDLLGKESATQVLTRWCADLHLAAPAIVRAIRDASVKDASEETRALLKADSKEPIRYRRVKLTCGKHILSEADNWYVPSRLTPEMNQTLDTTDTSFGTVVKPLGFHRKTLDALPAPDAAPNSATVLRVRAILLTPDETPFSLVVESYQKALTPPQ